MFAKLPLQEPQECCPIMTFALFSPHQSSAKNMHNLLLGCLLDLCENPKSVAHIMAWRGQKDCTAASLLLQIWREEEMAIGVTRDDTGRIAGQL